jgi:hypothetical protein
MTGSPQPTFGSWHTHHCDPPCPLDRLADAQKARRKMTKLELLVSFEQADEAWLNLSEEHDMAEAYCKDLETHLRTHGCTHDLAALDV